MYGAQIPANQPTGDVLMVRLVDLDELSRQMMIDFDCPTMEGRPWVKGRPLAERRVAIVSTAGLERRDDPPFHLGSSDYRVIPGDVQGGDLVMTHSSINFDRSGFHEDINVAFPIDRLRELAADGTIGSIGDFHYTFMGVTHPDDTRDSAIVVAGLLKDDNVDSVILAGV
jgi:D-proline reductase (dithiol) PrdB